MPQPAFFVTATVPATAVLNAWFDFNADGDWDDAGEHVFAGPGIDWRNKHSNDNHPSGATVGSTFARFRVTSTAGYSYFGLAPDGEVEDYQVTISAASSSSPGVPSSGLLDARAVALADERLLKNDWSAPSISTQRQTGEAIPGSEKPTAAEVIDLAIAEVALSRTEAAKGHRESFLAG